MLIVGAVERGNYELSFRILPWRCMRRREESDPQEATRFVDLLPVDGDKSEAALSLVFYF